MIKTIALLGAGKISSALAVAFALKAPDGHLVEVFDDDDRALKKVRDTLKGLKLKSHSVWFSNSIKNATWGSDVIVLDMPARQIMPTLKQMEDGPNKRALVTSAIDLPDRTSQAMQEFIKNAGLQYARYESENLKSVWTKAGFYSASKEERVQFQAAFKFDKT